MLSGALGKGKKVEGKRLEKRLQTILGKAKEKSLGCSGWSGSAMVLGKLPVPGRHLDDSRETAYCACSWCGWGLFEHFYTHLSCFSSVSLSLGDSPK